MSVVTSWEQEYGNSYRTAQDLIDLGLIASTELPEYEKLLRRFPFRLSRYYASLIDKENPTCPVRLQAIPQLEEERGEGLEDPLSDLQHQGAPRITHRYRNRALLHLTPNCSMYCRYCFRKTLLGNLKEQLFVGTYDPALHYLREHPEVEEIILSGGDPLLLSDSNLESVFSSLLAIRSIKRLRIHSRVPVTFPTRINANLLRIFNNSTVPVVLVTHFNHPVELTLEAKEVAQRLKASTHFLLNQSVLLKGVNDSAETLAKLQLGLFEMGVQPYYLHHPDPSLGTAHFRVSISKGKEIYHQLRTQLPGYLVPRYVIDRVGAPYKEDVVAASLDA